MRDHPREVEDFTIPFLWSAGVLLFCALFALWAAVGLPMTVLVCLLLARLIDRLPTQSGCVRRS